MRSRMDDSGSGRSKWSYERFLANNDAGAKLVAVNFFFAQFDESVSQCTEQKKEWMTVAVPVPVASLSPIVADAV